MKKILRIIRNTILTIICIFLGLLCLHTFEMHFAQKKYVHSAQPVKYPIGYSNLSLHTDGNEYYKELFNDIKNAKKEIHIYFFSISNDSISHQFLNLLKEKSDEGIKVYYAVDRLGGILLSPKQKKKLQKHGVHFAYFNPPKPYYFFASLNHRNHRRMTIIDGEIGYIGGFNIGKKYLGENKKLKHWEDFQLRLEGSGVEGLEKQFVTDWRNNSNQKIKQMEISTKKGNSPHQFVSYTRKGLEDEYVRLIKEAKDTITIYSPYFIPNNKKIWNTLLEASDKGTDVKILYSHKSDAIFVEQAAIPYIKQARKHNIKVYGYKGGIFHGKALKIDQSLLMVGTTNFDSRSFHLTDEINCYIYDQDFISSVEPTLMDEFNHAFEITSSNINKLSWKDRIKLRFGKVIEYYL